MPTISNRGLNFTAEEDLFIATGWVNASENNIIGANQVSFFYDNFESNVCYQ